MQRVHLPVHIRKIGSANSALFRAPGFPPALWNWLHNRQSPRTTSFAVVNLMQKARRGIAEIFPPVRIALTA